ncbi:MAG TPA: MotA/TolQ/ExbB proton channel family protein [Thermoanaerobaculia bacterium]|nr:MotA/TolQ/ExbB proton channel family protein [Thermoanaerobaculia bacterium]HUM28902.1 MotA/TolQ/ExbB proton channel family protein [Thermoanaerobaculia bacterium]HXK67165.1 MotA/TolQ/ExbB proton channel family protein [Thermoanaerobaculia bacterium]
MDFFGTLVKYYRQGGIVMHFLLVLSIAGVTVFIERLITLGKAKINVAHFLTNLRKVLIQNRDIDAAIKVCERYKGPVASVVKAGLLKYGEPKEEIEKAIESAAVYEMGRLEKFLIVLASVANVGPLLGFLGTVTGMIKSFDALAKAGLSNPALVAQGISEALITTAAGLFIAIPMQLAYNYFTSRINKFVRDIETSSNILMETLAEIDKGKASEGNVLGS